MKLNKRTKIVRDRIKKDEFETDEEGRAIVRINITDADNLLSVYNDDGMQIISEDTAEFINNITKPIPHKQDIHLRISCVEYTKDKEQQYRDAITNYYVNEFAHRDVKLRRNMINSIWLLCVGVVLFTLLYGLAKWEVPDIIYLLCEVVCWVFVWEAVDTLWLRRHEIKLVQYKELQIIFAKISFRKLDEKDKF
jgi:hypothetical protein